MIVAILQARTSSTRLPGKVLKPILGLPLLLQQINRIKRANKIDQLVVATSTDASDDTLAALCQEHDIACFRGSLSDVLSRFFHAAKAHHATQIVRLTGDCPLLDPAIVDEVIDYHLTGQFDYTNNTKIPSFPDGLDVEIMTMAALEKTFHDAKLPSEREHVTPFIYNQPALFKLGLVQYHANLSHLRWTVDNAEDFELVQGLYQALYPTNPHFNMDDVLNYLEQHPYLKTINSHHKRNAGMQNSLCEDEKVIKKQTLNHRYQRSQQLLQEALTVIPLGAQTFSKSITQFPIGISPHFLVRGNGCHVWDVDDNEYIDFINGLAAINLGYHDPDVDAAVMQQLQSGVSFSLSHPLELAVAKKIVEMVPCAEMVRFGKNGSDVTAGAIRLARAWTGREHVAVCGYHGWQDWYIGSTARNLGVPKATQASTHVFSYNNLDSLQTILNTYSNQVAAVILEPMNTTYPQKNFLEEVKRLTHEAGAVLIFDEVVTGFRFANGGAQALFGVTPDLAAFGKGIANGYPLAALAGKKELMKLMEDIFFSFTFGGETLSLAAALATLTKLETQSVISHINQLGQFLLDEVKKLIDKHQVHHLFDIVGHPAWTFLLIKDVTPYTQLEIKTLWMQEILARGILSNGTHNLTYAHKIEDIKQLLAVYDEVFPLIKEAVHHHTLFDALQAKPLQNLFKVR